MIGTDITNAGLALLQDKTAVHTDPADQLVWLNAGIREIVSLKPKAGTVTALLSIVAGSVSQTVPAGTIEILDVMANMGADGITPGRGITVTTMDRMNAAKPGWRRDVGLAIKHAIFDDRDNTTFYIWPAVASATKAEARLLKIPAAMTVLSGTVPLDDSYQNALLHYWMFMAHSQDGSHATNANLAAAHYGAFAQSLGVQIKGQKKAAPDTNSPMNPAAPAVDKNGA